MELKVLTWGHANIQRKKLKISGWQRAEENQKSVVTKKLVKEKCFKMKTMINQRILNVEYGAGREF